MIKKAPKIKAHHNPGTPKSEIKDTAEKALQRAIWNSEFSTIGKDKIHWIDFELPVNDNGTARDNCIDLLGIDNNGTYVICEVKFSGKGRGHGDPAYAANEVKVYDKQLDTYGTLFKLHKSNRRESLFSVEKLLGTTRRLIVVADKHYWDFWKSRLNPSKLPSGVEYYVINVANDEFANQRKANGGDSYKPHMPIDGIHWKSVLP